MIATAPALANEPAIASWSLTVISPTASPPDASSTCKPPLKIFANPDALIIVLGVVTLLLIPFPFIWFRIRGRSRKLTDRKLELEAQNRSLEARRQALEDRFEESLRQLNEATFELDTLKKQHNSLFAEHEDLKKKHVDMTEELEGLRKRVNNTEEAEKRELELRKRMREFELKLEEWEGNGDHGDWLAVATRSQGEYDQAGRISVNLTQEAIREIAVLKEALDAKIAKEKTDRVKRADTLKCILCASVFKEPVSVLTDTSDKENSSCCKLYRLSIYSHINPLTVDTVHTYCRECITNWMSHYGEDVQCPTCRKQIKSIASAKPMEEIINQYREEFPNAPYGPQPTPGIFSLF